MLVNRPDKGTFFHSACSQDQKKLIHEASLKILSQTGVKIFCKEALDLLREGGAEVDGELVKISSEMVEKALESAPSVFSIYDTEGNEALILEENHVYYGTGTDMPDFVDLYTNEIRSAKLQDCEFSAMVAQECQHIDWIAPMALSNDKNPLVSDLYHFKAMRQYSNKPNLTVAMDSYSLQGLIDMAALQAGGYDKLRDKPTFVHYSEPISPLLNSEEAIEKLLMCAEYGIPITYTSGIMAGATGPATLAGTIAVGNAENLAGLVLHQLKSKGSPFMYGIAVSIMDMKTTISAYGGPEQAMMHTIIGEMGRFYKLPSFGISGCTDSNECDLQMGAEIMFSCMCAALGGTNFVHDNGYMGAGQMGSLQSILASNEIIGFIKRFARGVDFSEESLALDLVEEIGPGGNFLQAMHTFKHFRTEYWQPEFFNRKRHMSWKEDGYPTIFEKITEKAKKIVEGSPKTFLDNDQIEEFDKIIAAHEKELVNV